IEDGPDAVHVFSLAAPSPNPFAVSSVFTYTLASSGTASLDVYDVSGRIVRNLVSGEQLSGTHSVTWAGDNSDGSPIPGGIYLLRLTSGGETAVRSCVVIR
ncbi:MAG: T9SS type A sorting domain-containing protein, partial [Candidatus Aegiribacteria sp.]|nr:T9SS type A sorting domain-containing protein [Candidatus Aegiribacteria sp.]